MSGQAHDLEGVHVLLKNTQVGMAIDDKAHDMLDRVIEPLLQAGKTVVIPQKPQRGCDRRLYKARRLIKSLFARLKQYRAIATRYDKAARNFLGAIDWAAAVV